MILKQITINSETLSKLTICMFKHKIYIYMFVEQ